MTRKEYTTPSGTIVYWTNDIQSQRPSLVFLPGLTADHRLFDRQTDYFSRAYNVMVWDAPAHGLSRPFSLDFSMDDLARFLHSILEVEGIQHLILAGQSFGGYISQCYMQLYPKSVLGFVSLDSAPLRRHYYTSFELAWLNHTYSMYYAIPWKWLIRWGSNGVAQSPAARQQMRTFMLDYSKTEYCLLAAYGYRLLGEAAKMQYQNPLCCPTILVCGRQDNAGSTRRYNRRWAQQERLYLHTIDRCGHNSPYDSPDEVNNVIVRFINNL